jgi:hypothetical protein
MRVTIQELEQIETEEGVTFSFRFDAKMIAVKGKSDTAVDLALERIAGHRDEVIELLRVRQGEPEQEVVREVAVNVPSLATQRQNSIKWFIQRSTYYHPSEAQLDLMFAACSEGDEIIFDFAHSFSVRRPNGLVVSVDRRGRISEPSLYSPALRAAKGS